MIGFEVIKALQIAVGLTVCGITIAYARKAWTALWADPDSLAVRYAVAIWGFCGLAQVIFYQPLVTSYIFDGAQPRETPGLPVGFRVFGLSLMLLFGAYILAVAPGRLEQTMMRFWAWLACMVIVGATVFIFLPYVPPT